MICFTMDIDWAPDEVVASALELFEQAGVKCTIFATHKSGLLQRVPSRLFEVGIHPNFNDLLKGNSQQTSAHIIQELLDIYPDANGIRSHSLTYNSYLLIEFEKLGLRYDANLFLPYQKLVSPFKLWNGLFRVSFNWEDDIHSMYGFSFVTSNLDLTQDCIFNFHPVHIYLNTETMARYQNAKQYYHDPKKLKTMANTTVAGTRNLLLDLLGKVKAVNIPNYTLFELVQRVEKN